MDGVVIYISADRGHALVWCSDHGPLGLARGEALPPDPLAVGDLVTFQAIEAGEMRLCQRLIRVPGRSAPGLAELLRARSRQTGGPPDLRLVEGAGGKGIAYRKRCG